MDPVYPMLPYHVPVPIPQYGMVPYCAAGGYGVYAPVGQVECGTPYPYQTWPLYYPMPHMMPCAVASTKDHGAPPPYMSNPPNGHEGAHQDSYELTHQEHLANVTEVSNPEGNKESPFSVQKCPTGFVFGGLLDVGDSLKVFRELQELEAMDSERTPRIEEIPVEQQNQLMFRQPNNNVGTLFGKFCGFPLLLLFESYARVVTFTSLTDNTLTVNGNQNVSLTTRHKLMFFYSKEDDVICAPDADPSKIWTITVHFQSIVPTIEQVEQLLACLQNQIQVVEFSLKYLRSTE